MDIPTRRTPVGMQVLREAFRDFYYLSSGILLKEPESCQQVINILIFRDFCAGIRDIVGGRSAAYEKELRRAKAIAIEEMQKEAQSMGANAVISVDLDYEMIGKGTMLMVSASGTAVTAE